MKRAAIVLVTLFPIALAAQAFQRPNPSSGMSQPAMAFSARAELSAADEESSSLKMDSSSDLPSYVDPNDPQQANASPGQSAPPPAPPIETKPKIPGSMVGYIDNPIVQNQIRIRFDAAFDDQFPDRSEFFYAKCGCYRHLNDPRFPHLCKRPTIPMPPDRASAYPIPSTTSNST